MSLAVDEEPLKLTVVKRLESDMADLRAIMMAWGTPAMQDDCVHSAEAHPVTFPSHLMEQFGKAKVLAMLTPPPPAQVGAIC